VIHTLFHDLEQVASEALRLRRERDALRSRLDTIAAVATENPGVAGNAGAAPNEEPTEGPPEREPFRD
jgi:hypothetical protein